MHRLRRRQERDFKGDHGRGAHRSRVCRRFQKDFDEVAELIARDYSDRFKDKRRVDRRPV